MPGALPVLCTEQPVLPRGRGAVLHPCEMSLVGTAKGRARWVGGCLDGGVTGMLHTHRVRCHVSLSQCVRLG